MDIETYISNGTLKVKVVPNASATKIVDEGDGLKVYLHAVPDKDKANKELIAFFKKEFGLRVLIKSGRHSREKVLQLV